MIEDNFDNIVNSMGKPEMEVVSALGLLPEMKEAIEDDSLFYYYTPEPGVEFVFDSETLAFIKMHIFVKPSLLDPDVYEGALPLGILPSWNRDKALAFFGVPNRSWENRIFPVIGERGGCDSFALAGHQDLDLLIGYTTDGDLEQISVLHKDRPA